MLKQVVVGAAGALVATLTIFVISQILNLLTIYVGPNVPDGAVVSFELDSCPEELGWYEYTQAQGMFIRGHDPEGARKLGTAQQDSIRTHRHGFQGRGAAGTTTADNGNDRKGLWHDGDFGQKVVRETSAVGGGETRPANIALLYCVKRGK